MIGVRTNDPELAARLRAVLRAHVEPSVDAPANLSASVEEQRRGATEFHRLYRGRGVAVRTRSLGRLLRATVANLDAFAPEPSGTTRLGGRVLVRDGRAVVVDSRLGYALERVERRVERLGYRLADVPGAPLDTDTLDIVLWPPRLELDETALAAAAADFPSVEPEVPVAAARLPVSRVLVPRPDASSDWTAARTLVVLAELVAVGAPTDGRALALAQRLLATVDVRPCPNDDAALLAALGESPG